MMKNIIYASILLISAIGYSQDKVSVKSSTPMEAIIVKKISSVETKQKKAIVKNDVVLLKQSIPVESRIVNFIGTPKITYKEPVALIKKEEN